jgi:hypothetical protein
VKKIDIKHIVKTGDKGMNGNTCQRNLHEMSQQVGRQEYSFTHIMKKAINFLNKMNLWHCRRLGRSG